MLIKCAIDDSTPFLSSASIGSGALAMWIVQENLPLDAPAQLEALAKAVGVDDLRKIDPKQICLIINNEMVDWSKNPIENKLMGGSIGTIQSISMTPRTARQERNGLSQADFENSFSMDPRTRSMSRFSGAMDGDDAGSNATAYAVDEDEIYVAEDCGWFPFKLENNYGQLAVGSFIDPTKPVAETDAHPHTQNLCPECSNILTKTDSIHLDVDRHFKPMAVRTEVCTGWVEKLSLNMIARWQKRYLIISEKSLDWFTEEPTAGLKTKIRGTRKVVTDAACNIGEIIDVPDPAQYPKCKDVNYFHFGVTFLDPPQTVFFRVNSIQDRNRYILFLKSTKERAMSTNKGSRRNPVYWKKWADAFLTNLTDLGEATVANDAEADVLSRRWQELRDKKAELVEERPGLEAVINEKREVVRRLATEIERVKVAKQSLQRDAEEAEEQIEVEKISLVELEAGMSDELRSAEMLRRHARSQRDDSDLKIQTLLEEIELLKERHLQTFRRWRKHEEQNGATIAFGRTPTKKDGSRGGDAGATPVSKRSLLSFSVDGNALAPGVRKLPEELAEAARLLSKSRGASVNFSSPGSFRLDGSLGGASLNSPLVETKSIGSLPLSPDARQPSIALNNRNASFISVPGVVLPSRLPTSVPLGSPIYRNNSTAANVSFVRNSSFLNISADSTPFMSPRAGTGAIHLSDDLDEAEGAVPDNHSMYSSIRRAHAASAPTSKVSRDVHINAIQSLIHHQASIKRSLGIIKEEVAAKKKYVPPAKPAADVSGDANAVKSEKEEAAGDNSHVPATSGTNNSPAEVEVGEGASEEPKTARATVSPAT